MNIIFYFSGFAPVGGIETFCKNLLSYLQSQKYDCRLVCWGKMSPLLQSIQQAKVKIFRTSWQWGCRWNLPEWLLLPLGIQQVKQADIVLFGKLIPTRILKKIKSQASQKTKFIYITPYRPLPLDSNTKKELLLEALNLFDLILVQGSAFANDLRQIGYQKRVEVIPYIPHQPSKIKPFAVEGELKVGFLGRLVEDKNIPLLLEAFRCFQYKYIQESSLQNIHLHQPSLHLFGDGHLREHLEQLTQKLGIASSVTFHGNIPNNEVEDIIASCHMFAFTSRAEGQCLAALEILGCGRPIVATDAGALPDILSDSRLGRIVHSADANNLAESLMEIAKLIQQKLISPEIIRSAYLERYAPDQVGARYNELLTSLCN